MFLAEGSLGSIVNGDVTEEHTPRTPGKYVVIMATKDLNGSL